MGSDEGGGGGGAVCSVGSGHGGSGGPRRAPQIGHVVPVGAEIMATLFTASQAFSSNIFFAVEWPGLAVGEPCFMES